MMFQGPIFYNDIVSKYTSVSISNNHHHCPCLLNLCQNNKILYNIVIQLAFFFIHSAILTINHKYKLFRTFGAWSYDFAYAFLAACTYNYMLRNYIPINDVVFIFAKYGTTLSYFFMLIQFAGIALVAYSPVYLGQWVKKNEGKLCDVNIFKYIRHPTYTGFFLYVFFRPEVTVGSLIYATTHAIYVYVAVFYNEEQRMIDVFGKSYEEYIARTPAFFPCCSARKNQSKKEE